MLYARRGSDPHGTRLPSELHKAIYAPGSACSWRLHEARREAGGVARKAIYATWSQFGDREEFGADSTPLPLPRKRRSRFPATPPEAS